MNYVPYKVTLAFVVLCLPLAYAEKLVEDCTHCVVIDDMCAGEQLITRSITKQNSGRPTTIQHNLHVKGDLVIDGDIIASDGNNITIHGGDLVLPPTSKIHTTNITPATIDDTGKCVEDTHGTLRFNNSVGIHPTGKLLVNAICPVKINKDGTYAEDTNGTLQLNGPVTISTPHALEVDTINPACNAIDATINCAGNLAIKQDHTLFINTIKPATTTPQATTTFQGNVCISNKQILGQTAPIHVIDQTTIPVLGIIFKTNDEALVSKGAFIELQLHGVATITTSDNTQSVCDVVIPFSVYIGPGSFGNQIIQAPRMILGQPTRGIEKANIEVSFDTRDDNTVLIQLKCLSNKGQDTIDTIDGIIYYQLTSANFDRLYVPKMF